MDARHSRQCAVRNRQLPARGKQAAYRILSRGTCVFIHVCDSRSCCFQDVYKYPMYHANGTRIDPELVAKTWPRCNQLFEKAQRETKASNFDAALRDVLSAHPELGPNSAVEEVLYLSWFLFPLSFFMSRDHCSFRFCRRFTTISSRTSSPTQGPAPPT